MGISDFIKSGGYIIIGLSNLTGRLRTDIRRRLLIILGERLLYRDPNLRNNLSQERRRAWIKDQCYHPQESKHSIIELMQWFEEAEFSFVSSFQKIVGGFRSDEHFFEQQKLGSSIDRTDAEI